MKAVVLGAAAGGGLPQWSSNAEACRQARADDGHVVPRTQASLAVSGGGERWFLDQRVPRSSPIDIDRDGNCAGRSPWCVAANRSRLTLAFHTRTIQRDGGSGGLDLNIGARLSR